MAYYFNLPQITNLTIEQQAVLNDTGAVSISGGPGTGKSVVSLWRHIRNYGTGVRRSLLLTYTKTLETYLRSTALSENQIAALNINRTLYWLSSNGLRQFYDEIIVDEAQDVSVDKYQELDNYTDLISYGADDNQILFPQNGCNENQLNNLFPRNRSYRLHENFRNTYEIIHFVKGLFPNRFIPQETLNALRSKRGNKPILGIISDQKSVIKQITENYNSSSHNIAVLVPLAADVDRLYASLQSIGIECSKFHNRIGQINEINRIHITTFKSSKGTEYNTVILPDFQNYKSNLANLYVVEENDYYVAMTRAKNNLFMLSTSNLDFLPTDTYDVEIY